jgi:hypothetical protein
VDIPATSDNIPGTLVLRGATGDVKIGIASPAPHVTAPLTVTGGSTSGAALATYVYGATNTGIASYRANGTAESPTQVLSGERFAFLVGGTYGTTGFANPAAMNFHAAENQTDTARGSFITFDTCATGQTARQERLRIDASGNVGIGIVPDRPLHVHRSGVNSALHLTTSTSSSTLSGGMTVTSEVTTNFAYVIQRENAPLVFRTADTERMRITGGGEVYIAGSTDQGAFNLQCNGTGVWGAGAYTNGSDERLKENIAEITEGLEVVKNLRPVSFNYKETHSKDRSKQAGFIAQDLLVALAGKDYLEGTVTQGPEYYNVAYQNLIPIMTKAIQELTAKVEALEAAQ